MDSRAAESWLVEQVQARYERQYQAGAARRVRVLWMRHVEELTYREMAERLDVTPGRVRQIERGTLSKIRRASPRLPDFQEQAMARLPDALVVAIWGWTVAPRYALQGQEGQP